MVNTNSSWYQYPNSTDTEGIFEFFGFVNRTADGLFFPVILIVIWFISFVGAFNAGGQTRPAGARAFIFAGFICSITSSMFVIMGFLSSKLMYLTFFLTALGMLWLKLENSRE